MSHVEVRRANGHDVSRLVSLAEEFMPETATHEERLSILKGSLKDSDYELWVAEMNGDIVGFIDLWIIHDFCHGGKLSYIQNLYVVPKYRRLGVGSKLLQKIIERAEKKGVLEIHVVTEFDNEAAIRLYKKHGFEKGSLQLEKEFK
ncbi:MAG: GNAT family N-acetyltransferase [Candidatus Bathyarchaeia archaeon]